MRFLELISLGTMQIDLQHKMCRWFYESYSKTETEVTLVVPCAQLQRWDGTKLQILVSFPF